MTNASAKAADMLKAACQADESKTPPARLAAIDKRLDTISSAAHFVAGNKGNDDIRRSWVSFDKGHARFGGSQV